jgi:hypothetical protein
MHKDRRHPRRPFNATLVASYLRGRKIESVQLMALGKSNTNYLRHMDSMHHGEIEAGLVAGGLNVPPDWRRKAEFADLSSHLEFLTTQRSDAFKQRCADWIRDFAERY